MKRILICDSGGLKGILLRNILVSDSFVGGGSRTSKPSTRILNRPFINISWGTFKKLTLFLRISMCIINKSFEIDRQPLNLRER